MPSPAFQVALAVGKSPVTNSKKCLNTCKLRKLRVQAAKRSRRYHVHHLQSESPCASAGSAGSPSQRDFQPGWGNSPFEQNEVVGSRYAIKGILGRGANGITFEACVLGDSASRVALKALSFKAMSNWKALDLFQREARTLRSLSNPAVPEYIDFLEVEKAGDKVFVLVQRKAPGVSLQCLLDDGYRFSTFQVKAIFQKLLEVLQYLSSLNPPVMHRDVKPSNVILDLISAKELHLSLVDFGGVNTGVLGGTTTGSLGSTMVGTFGYMAPEQFSGGGDVRSDLYAAAATILYILTGRSPSSLPQKRLKIDVESVIPERERLKLGNVYTVMCKLLEPAPEDRYDTAMEALDALLSNTSRRPTRQAQRKGSTGDENALLGIDTSLSTEQAVSLQRAFANIEREPATSKSNPIEMITGWAGRRMRRRKPSGSRVILDRDRSNRLLRISIPPKGFSGKAVSKGLFAMAWTGFTAFWTVGVLTGGAPIVFSLFSIPFWAAGAQMAKSTIDEVAGLSTLVVSFGGGEKEVFYFGMTSKSALGHVNLVEGDARDLTQATRETSMYVNGQPVSELVLQEGTNRHVFGKGLADIEQEWLRDEINDFLNLRYRQ